MAGQTQARSSLQQRIAADSNIQRAPAEVPFRKGVVDDTLRKLKEARAAQQQPQK